MALIVLGAICLALAVALVLRERDHAAAQAAADERHQDERRELVNRIQNPSWVPPLRKEFKPAEPPKDATELATIGTVVPYREPGEDD